MDLNSAAQHITTFMDEYIEKNNGFSRTGNRREFQLDFQEAYVANGGVVVVFAVPSSENVDDPSPEIHSLAARCCSAFASAQPEFSDAIIGVEYLSL